MPNAVSVPSGAISVTRPPTPIPSRLASRSLDEFDGDDVVGDQLAGSDVLGANAADERAGGAGVSGRHDLALDQRRCADHPRHLPDAGGGGLEIGEPVGFAVDGHVPV